MFLGILEGDAPCYLPSGDNQSNTCILHHHSYQGRTKMGGREGRLEEGRMGG